MFSLRVALSHVSGLHQPRCGVASHRDPMYNRLKIRVISTLNATRALTEYQGIVLRTKLRSYILGAKKGGQNSMDQDLQTMVSDHAAAQKYGFRVTWKTGIVIESPRRSIR